MLLICYEVSAAEQIRLYTAKIFSTMANIFD